MNIAGAWRKILKGLALGCGCLSLLFGALVIWIGVEIFRASRPLELSDHHPFRSAAKKERYLAHYDARAERWPVVSVTLMVDTSWGSTFVRVSGPPDGTPLILLPGAGGSSLMWEPNIEALSRVHRVFAVDNVFDFGRSVYIRNLKTPNDFVSWLDDLLDGLGLEKTHLTGLSYGGWIASQYGLERPNRVERLVLIAPAATILQLSPDFIKNGILSMIPHRHFIKNFVYWALADAAAGPEEQRRMVEEAANDAWLAIRSFKPKQMVAPTLLSDDQLRSLSPPTLFLVGEDEVIYSGTGADAVQRLNSVAPGIVTEIIPDCGHGITMVQADVVNRRILEFLGQDKSSIELNNPS